jgi:hypothetical protein
MSRILHVACQDAWGPHLRVAYNASQDLAAWIELYWVVACRQDVVGDFAEAAFKLNVR